MTTITKQLTQPKSFWAAVDALAATQSLNRSEWLYAAAIAKMPPDVRRSVADRAPMGRPVKE